MNKSNEQSQYTKMNNQLAKTQEPSSLFTTDMHLAPFLHALVKLKHEYANEFNKASYCIIYEKEKQFFIPRNAANDVDKAIANEQIKSRESYNNDKSSACVTLLTKRFCSVELANDIRSHPLYRKIVADDGEITVEVLTEHKLNDDDTVESWFNADEPQAQRVANIVTPFGAKFHLLVRLLKNCALNIYRSDTTELSYEYNNFSQRQTDMSTFIVYIKEASKMLKRSGFQISIKSVRGRIIEKMDVDRYDNIQTAMRGKIATEPNLTIINAIKAIKEMMANQPRPRITRNPPPRYVNNPRQNVVYLANEADNNEGTKRRRIEEKAHESPVFEYDD